MIRLAVIAIVCAIAAAPAAAGLPSHPGAHGRIVMTTTREPRSITSRASIPATAKAVGNVTFNGHRADYVWNDSPQIIEFAWHGVIATLNFHKKDGPVTLRVASTRSHPIAVRATVSWSS